MIVRNVRRCMAWFVWAALSACQHASPAPRAANAGRLGTPPRALQAAATPAPLAPPALTPTPSESSPFIEGIRLGYSARLAVAGKTAFLSTEKLLLAVHDDQVTIDPALLEGLHPARSQFPRVFGSMPDAAWALEVSYAERTSRSTLSRWTGSEWVNADALLKAKNVIGISAWTGGRTLALVADDYSNQLGFVQLAGARGLTLPQLKRTAHNGDGCVHGIQPTAMSALASGEVFLAGALCSISEADGVQNHGVVVERWQAGHALGKVLVLPGLAEQEASSAELTQIVAASGSDVFVAGVREPKSPAGDETHEQAYVAHFDGQAWQALPAPPVERIEELQRSAEGTLWALSSGDLWTTRIGLASWERVALPQMAAEAGEHAVSSFWVRSNSDVWATVGSDGFSYLLRTQRGAQSLSVPSDAQVAELSNAVDPMAAYHCESPTLVLLTLSRQAPANADVPSVRAALRGHTELEGKVQFIELPFLTRRYLGVRGELQALRLTRELLSQSNIAGVDPELRCLNAPPTRTLTMDFSGTKAAVPEGGRAASLKVKNPRPGLQHLD